jgi:hypothetical protein
MTQRLCACGFSATATIGIVAHTTREETLSSRKINAPLNAYQPFGDIDKKP